MKEIGYSTIKKIKIIKNFKILKKNIKMYKKI